MAKRWVVMAALAAVLVSARAASAEGISWRSDLKGAMTEATRNDRLVMINFYDKDCSWCKRMDDETLSNAEVVSATSRVVPVRVDVDQAPEMVKLYAIRGVPAFIFVEGTGEEADRIEGFVPAPAFLDRVNGVLTEQDKLTTLRKKVAADPNDYDSKADLARVYVHRRLGDRAAPLVDSLAALPKDKAPKDLPDLMLGTGIAFGSRGNNDRAILYLDKVVKGYPGTEQADWAGFFTGLALGLKGDQKAAMAQLQQVAENAKSDEVRQRAKALLDRFKDEPAVPTL